MVRDKLFDNGGNWIVVWKRSQFGVQPYASGRDPDPGPGRVQNLDIRMNLRNRHGKRRAVIHHRVLAEEYDLARRRGFHEK